MSNTAQPVCEQRDYGFGEQQALLLDMVKVIDDICRRHHIECSYAVNICPKEYFSGVVDMPFEDTMLPVLAQYDKQLTRFYGDYMTPPPEDQKQAFWHQPYILDLHRSYREYVNHE